MLDALFLCLSSRQAHNRDEIKEGKEERGGGGGKRERESCCGVAVFFVPQVAVRFLCSVVYALYLRCARSMGGRVLRVIRRLLVVVGHHGNGNVC